MGISTSSYIGPYVVCKTHKVPSVENIRTCSDPSCKKYSERYWGDSTKFCPDCGTKILEREKPIQIDNANYWEVQQLIQESLCVPSGDSFHEILEEKSQHIWIANRTVPDCARNFWFNSRDYDTSLTEITPEMCQDETQKFKLFFEKEIEILRAEYGEENVSVHWGYLSWVS